jgi:chromosomal replication initiator protein
MCVLLAPPASLRGNKNMQQNTEQIWQQVLESIRVSVSGATFNTWLMRTYLTKLEKLEEGRYLAEIGCQSTFIRTTVEQRYYGLLQDAIKKTINASCDLVFVTKSKPSEAPQANLTEPLFQEHLEEVNPPQQFDENFMNRLAYSRLRPFFTFENFAVSGSNQMAYAAAEAVAQTPGTAYNPLFLWGGVGVGKTHVMNAVGHVILRNDPLAKVYACTGEDFTNDIISGIRNKSTQHFREKYRKLKALFIDDIQFIAGKDTVQEEFFHTFNAITASGGQIILTSDRPPSDISKLEERLRSRFEAGLIVDIAPPDFELRCAIVQIKAREKGIIFPSESESEIVQLIAGNVETARKIEGFLIRLSSEVKLKNLYLSEDLVRNLLGKGPDEGIIARKPNANPEIVIEAVSHHFSIARRALLGQSRAKMIARPRQMLMYILRTEFGLPLEEVGRIVGGRDHTTVMHAVDRITRLASDDVHIREDLLGIKKGF